MDRQMFRPIKQEKLSVKISSQIKTLIIEGELKPGDPLPPERELMHLLNVSRPSIREALKSLIGMGFLEASKGNRTIVKSLASGRMLDPLHQLLKDDIMVVFELIEVRKAIEAWNAYYAAKRATPADIERLEKNVASLKEKIGDHDFVIEKVDADFHLAISEATHNKIQTHIMFTIYDIIRESIGKYFQNINYNDVYHQHQDIVQAIKVKNPDAAREKILEHLEYVETRIKELVNSR
ncbi:MAG: FadR/GntR family transcriptional regulator [Desulfobacterales bacterium]|nr:FadR/GntR family transcriptional regulator [Desulfobacterales bacterium]